MKQRSVADEILNYIYVQSTLQELALFSEFILSVVYRFQEIDKLLKLVWLNSVKFPVILFEIDLEPSINMILEVQEVSQSKTIPPIRRAYKSWCTQETDNKRTKNKTITYIYCYFQQMITLYNTYAWLIITRNTARRSFAYSGIKV